MLDDLISPAALEKLAGPAAFERGKTYFSIGAVQRMRASESQVTATVQGTHAYQTQLRSDAGAALACHCSCPHAADGYFCKHGVALGLAWLAENSAPPGKKKSDPWQGIEAYLGAQAPQTLIELLLEVAQRDDRLYQSLRLKAERVGAGANVAPIFRQAIDGATHIHDFIEWEDVRDFADTLDQLADSLAELLKPGTAATLVELAEYAIEQIEASLEQMDDSDGEVGDVVLRLGELHLQACLMARPDPQALAERLFELTFTLAMGLCSLDPLTYREVLGAQGLRRYRELADAEWAKLKPLDAKNPYNSRRSTLTRMLEQLAEASGDWDELVAIKSRDLSSAWRYLDIAQVWSAAGQPDKALQWAERGLTAFPEKTDNRLRDFLVAAYLPLQRNDEALQLTWLQFEERPSLAHYQKLSGVAGQIGVWPAQRERALAALAETIAREAATPSQRKPEPSRSKHALRLEIALWEEDLDAAWQAAHAGDCGQYLLVRLASKLEASRPHDAISLYRRVVPSIIDKTNNAAYEEGVVLIRKIGGLMKAQGQQAAFDEYLAQLRLQFKLKRNFIKLLDKVALRDL